MRAILATLTALTLSLPAAAADTTLDGASVLDRWAEDPTQIFDAADVDLDALSWVARPVVVFASSPRDPSFVDQMEELSDGLSRLVDRDVILITDTDPDGASDLRRKLRPRAFMLVLLGKDGEVKLRKPLPWTVRELTRTIDKMPMRQQELRDR